MHICIIQSKLPVLPGPTVGHTLRWSGAKNVERFTLHDFACHPCAGAMLIFSVFFQFSCDAEASADPLGQFSI